MNTTGHATHADASRLLITADGGGSNDYRTRLFTTELATLTTETVLQITMCHLPPAPVNRKNRVQTLLPHLH
ncbi:ISAzo13-like element transposase-related protein [Arthrobacter psychrolactophilus]